MSGQDVATTPSTASTRDLLERLMAAQPVIRTADLVRAAGVSRQAAHHHLRQAVRAGRLERRGAGRASRYVVLAPGGAAPVPPLTAPPPPSPTAPADERPPASPPLHRKRYARRGLAEDRVWDAVAPTLGDLDPPAQEILRYATTELVNNAVDHSEGETVAVTVRRRGACFEVEVRDDGVGVFERVRRGLGLDTALDAVLELHKGKTTTMPDRHSGEGIFFVSKAADLFELASGQTRYLVDNLRDDMAVLAAAEQLGTRATVQLDTPARRTLRSVFDSYTDDLEFARTRTVIRLFALAARFVSRSEAKRLLYRLERFREVMLDFAGVAGVGQGFADEVFRVWARAHPRVKLRPLNMNEAVAFMVRRAQAPGQQPSCPPAERH